MDDHVAGNGDQSFLDQTRIVPYFLLAAMGFIYSHVSYFRLFLFGAAADLAVHTAASDRHCCLRVHL